MINKTLKGISAFAIATTLFLTTLSSCKPQEGCPAYNGSKKSSRSVTPKRNHRHAEVISIQISKQL
jgi:hypothetical protein